MPVARLIYDAAESHRFKGSCPIGLAVGDWVFTTGDAVADVYPVDEADIAQFSNLPASGVIVEKPTSTTCTVQWGGAVSGVFSSLQPRRVYYLQSDGSIDVTPPPDGLDLYVQRLGFALDSKTLLVTPNVNLIKRP